MFIILLLVILVTAAYLNRSYASIYRTIDEAHLASSDDRHVYRFENASPDTRIYVAIGDSLTAGVGVSSYEESSSSKRSVCLR